MHADEWPVWTDEDVWMPSDEDQDWVDEVTRDDDFHQDEPDEELDRRAEEAEWQDAYERGRVWL